jgi:hypothetical protein
VSDAGFRTAPPPPPSAARRRTISGQQAGPAAPVPGEGAAPGDIAAWREAEAAARERTERLRREREQRGGQ